MNSKRVFGAILTLLGIGGLVYAAEFTSESVATRHFSTLVIFGVLGLMFFISGISLIRTTKDAA